MYGVGDKLGAPYCQHVSTTIQDVLVKFEQRAVGGRVLRKYPWGECVFLEISCTQESNKGQVSLRSVRPRLCFLVRVDIGVHGKCVRPKVFLGMRAFLARR